MQVFARLTTLPCFRRDSRGRSLGNTLPAHPFELALFPSAGDAVPKGWIRSFPSTPIAAERRRPTLQNMHHGWMRRSLPKKRSLLHVEKRSLLHAETASKRGREAEASHRSTHRMQTAVHVAYRWRRVDANTGRRGRALMWTGLQARAALAGFGGCRSCARSRSPGRVPLQLLDLDGADLVLGGFRDAVEGGVGEPVGVAVLEVERHPRLARVRLA